jgi:hypothetical protein
VSTRERNGLLHAAGFAPAFTERALDDPALGNARRAVDLVLKGHEPYPALAVDRHWNLVAWNDAVAPLLAGADASLVKPPINVLRLSLHPSGLSSRIRNLEQWRGHLLERLRSQIETTADARLTELMKELEGYPRAAAASAAGEGETGDYGGVAVPLELVTGDGTVLAFISTTTVFGTPLDVTLAELAVEAFFPADDATAAALGEAAVRRRQAARRAAKAS